MDPSLIESLSALARREHDALAEPDFAAQRARFLRHAARRTTKKRIAKLVLAPAALTLVAWLATAPAALTLVMRSMRAEHPEPVLRYRAAGAQGVVGEWLAAPDAAALPIAFSDGSQLTLREGSRARVVDMNARGARVMLERGSLTAAVEHNRDTRWQLDAGPFRVAVVGTRFTLGWDPKAESFELELHEGSVRVSGPRLQDKCAVARGERVRVALHAGASSGSCVIQPPPPTSPPTAASREMSPDAPAAEPPPPLKEHAAKAPPPRRPDWQRLESEGQHRQAWAALQAQGFDEVLRRAARDELLVIADLARYAGDATRARSALTSLRARFPGTAEAAQGAFMLGRVLADQLGDPEEAAVSFSTYLREQPDGSLSREALGRLLDCQQRAGQRLAARDTAHEYLQRYPQGPYGALAEHVLTDIGNESSASGEGRTR